MILVLFGIVGVIWFLLPYFSFRIINIGNATGIVVSLIIMLLGVFRKPLTAFAVNLLKSTKGTVILTLFGIIFFAIVSIVGVEIFCVTRAALKKPADDATVVVLGCRVIGERPSLMLQERLDAAFAYLEDNPQAVAILSGGKGADENISEAECMFRYLKEKGIAEERLFLEDRSTTTRENLLYSKEIIDKNHLNSKLAIVTNEFHEYRGSLVARDLGFEVAAVPATTAWYLFPTFFVRELYGILYQWVF